ncbi:MAG: peptidoglycan DD-metalloendopeptidase family protein [Oscillospiraceae bacterium]|nr:peptidoglycan DD-metalloendopeptidase family protein [Oscillospiraceae bacterium]
MEQKEFDIDIHSPMPQPTHEKKTSRPFRPFNIFYSFAEQIGIFLIDGGIFILSLLKKASKAAAKWASDALLRGKEPLTRFAKFWQTLLYEFTDPFSKLAGDVMGVYEIFRSEKPEERKEKMREQRRQVFHSFFGAIGSLLNHVMPLMAAVALIFVLGRTFHQEYLLEVTCNGQVLGYVDSELVYQEAANMVAERAVFDKTVLLPGEEESASVEEKNPENATGNSSDAMGTGSFSLSEKYTGRSAATYLVTDPKNHAHSMLIAQKKEATSNSDSEEDVKAEVKTSFRLVPVSGVEKDDSESLCEKLIAALGDQLETATGLYVDDVLYGAVTDGKALNSLLQNMLAKADDGNGSVSFYKSVKLQDGLYPTNVILDQETMEKLVTGKVSGKKEYTIQAGDAPLSIAAKFDLDYSDFLAMNPTIEDTCYVGQVVTIANEQAFLPILVTKQITYKQTVAYTTKTVTNPSYYSSYVRITQQGKTGEDTITAKVSYIDGVEVDREIIKTVRTKQPVQPIVVRGTLSYYQPSGGGTSSSQVNKAGFIWPASGTISCRWWGYYNHQGLDIAGYTGAPIWAAADGTVIYSGWKYGGYGYYVLIDHGNGYKTGYMHNSALLVRAGDRVKQGQQIAKMGSTGNSSGPHCHFEVWVNGVLKNPEHYLP